MGSIPPLGVLPRIDDAVDLRGYLPEICGIFGSTDVSVAIVIAGVTADAASLGTLFVDYVMYAAAKRRAIATNRQLPSRPFTSLQRVEDPTQIRGSTTASRQTFRMLVPHARPHTLTICYNNTCRTMLPIQRLERINADTYAITVDIPSFADSFQLQTDEPATFYRVTMQ